MARPSHSWVWEFYIDKPNTNLVSGSHDVECKFCHKTFKYTSRNGPTNLSKHLIRMHQIETGYLFRKKCNSDLERVDDAVDEQHLSSIINDLAGSHMNLDNSNVLNMRSGIKGTNYEVSQISDNNLIVDNNTSYESMTDFMVSSSSNTQGDIDYRATTVHQLSASTDQPKAAINLLPIYRLKVAKKSNNIKVSKLRKPKSYSSSNDISTRSESLKSRLHNYEMLLQTILSTRNELNSSNMKPDQNTVIQLNDIIDKLLNLISIIFQDIKKLDLEKH